MKANEAPEKIYIKDTDIHLSIYSLKGSEDEVEYIRADAFIEKAVNWLMLQEEMIGVSFQEDFIERFKNYMKG